MTLKLFYFNDNVHKDKEVLFSAFNITFSCVIMWSRNLNDYFVGKSHSYALLPDNNEDLLARFSKEVEKSKTTKNCDIETC